MTNGKESIMFYILLVIAALFYSLTFFFNQNVERKCKPGINTAILFSTVAWFEIFVILLAIVLFNGDLQPFNPLSFICGGCCAFFMLAFSFVNFKALAVADLGKYSLFTMLGGMVIPSISGILFFNEPITIGKIICVLLIAISMYVDSHTGKIDKKSLIYLILVFFVNGSFGVIATIHQRGVGDVSNIYTIQYMCSYAMIISLLGTIWLLCHKLADKQFKIVNDNKAYIHMLLYGIIYGAAEIILLFSIVHVDASTQYPIVTGGTIIFSAIIALITAKQKNFKMLIPIAIAFAGMLCLLNVAGLNSVVWF